MRIDAQLIDALLLGVGGRRRELQDLPVLGDVWASYAKEPGKAQDLLFTPTWEKPTGDVARLLATTDVPDGEAIARHRKISYLQGLVVGELTLEELIAVALPGTKWWDQICDLWEQELLDDIEEEGEGYPTDADLADWIVWRLDAAVREEGVSGKLVDDGPEPDRFEQLDMEDRQAAKLALLLGILRAAEGANLPEGAKEPLRIGDLRDVLPTESIVDAGVAAIRLMIRRRRELASAHRTENWNGYIFKITLNRPAAPAVAESVGAVKADAARSLFSISCKEIGWAVIDSGIDQTHPAFWDYEAIWKEQEKAEQARAKGREPQPPAAPRPNRIKATFDFRRVRAILSVGGVDHDQLVGEIQERTGLDPKEIKERLDELAADRAEGKRVNWARVRKLIEQKTPDPPSAPPLHPHGTHVAGIIGAHWLDFKRNQEPTRTDPVRMTGVCPDITLYDFRVLGSTLGDSEYAVIAALEFIRFLNDQSGYAMINGVNMSLSIPHNVRNYACGRTQICVESEALLASGVVVVAAAGNRGYQQFRLADNSTFENYAASSITDPGNAEGVITVGATHRSWPHTYGVSFFSSRGPTGDGRMKPDLLAPGEKITSCVPGAREDEMDGTSMAAPHVSGAAALLMARHEELKGQPARIKQILCATATDLKRERSFQGHGMVDVLRAIQSV